MKHDDCDDSPGPQKWTTLFQAFSDSFEWALDLAGGLARAYPDEVATVERVRAFVRRRVAGDPAHIRLDDLLFTLGLIAGAMQRDVLPAFTAATRPIYEQSPDLPATDVTQIAAKPARTLHVGVGVGVGRGARRRARSAPARGTHAVRATRVATVRRGSIALAAERWLH